MFVVASCGSTALPVAATTTSWWVGTGGGVSSCGPPAVYRVNGGALHAVGSCAGILFIPPTHVTVAVGGEVDVHITEEPSGPTGNHLVPIYPTPFSDDTSVLVPTSVADGGATESFIAVGSGAANVLTRAWCLVTQEQPDVDTTCPVLAVGVS
jgi:hypothetical protein